MKKIDNVEFVSGQVNEEVIRTGGPTTTIVIFRITKNGETREFSPKKYLELILESNYRLIDKQKSYRKKMIALSNTEHILKRTIVNNSLKETGEDFSELLDDLRIQEKRFQIYYEPYEKLKFLLIGAAITLVAGLIPKLIELALEPHQESRIEFPKMMIIHDTVYLQKNPVNSQTGCEKPEKISSKPKK